MYDVAVKRCPKCNTEKSYDSFSKDKNRRDGFYVYCKTCMRTWSREFRLRKPRSSQNSTIKYKYGITIDQYNQKLIEQSNCCAICGTDKPGGGHNNLYVDHNHSTGKVRGLLCRNCNLMLGHAFDKVELLEEAIKYLNRWQVNQ